jgi:hypothetical protein
MKLESIILDDFFNMLNEKGINYCVMNNYTEMPEVIPSDVDIALEEKDFRFLDNMVNNLAFKHNVSITQKIWHGYNKCAYILSPLETEKYFWLQLDFFVDFCAKGYPNLIPVSDMLSRKSSYKNFHIPNNLIETLFIIQRRIIKGDLKVKHIETLSNLYKSDEKSIAEEIVNMFGNELGEKLLKVICNDDLELFNNNFKKFRIKLKQISNNNTNLKYRLGYFFQQVKRIIYRILYPTGLSIAFIGNCYEFNNNLIEQVDKTISGSFHGTYKCNPKSCISFIINDLLKSVIAKITKRKVYINVSDKWNRFGYFSFRSIIFLKPDVIFNFKKAINVNDNAVLNEITFKILLEQSNRTEKHLFSILSPTSYKLK